MATDVLSFRDDTSSHEDWHDFEVLGLGDEPKILIKKSSMQSQSERRISIDPKSLLLSSTNQSFDIDNDVALSSHRLDHQVKTKFISSSLPNSTATSPRHSSRVQNRTTEQVLDLILVQEATFRRSKSCGEGRAFTPSVDFDMLVHKSRHDNNNTKILSNKSSGNNSFFSKTDSNKSNNNNNTTTTNPNTNPKNINSTTFEDGFKCSALCLYLPGFSKGKPIRSSSSSSSRKGGDSSFTRTTTMTSSQSMARKTSINNKDTNNNVLSARASLERFECGSWTSSAMIYDDNADLGGHFFDLPSELIKGGSGGYNDQDDPVSAAFVFDKEPNLEKLEIKGVLKTSGSKSRRSMESPRHVRFSTSSPVSYPTSPVHSNITPRLIQATEDFSSFLEAQVV